MQFPKAINTKAMKIFHRLIRDLPREVGSHTQWFNGKPYMPLSIEIIDQIRSGGYLGSFLMSFCHYWEHPSRDLMRDPEVVMLWIPSTDRVFPMSFRNDGLGIDNEYMRLEGDKIKFNAKQQHDLTDFVQQWCDNLQEQQIDAVDKADGEG